jgi:hypothetical protein
MEENTTLSYGKDMEFTSDTDTAYRIKSDRIGGTRVLRQNNRSNVTKREPILKSLTNTMHQFIRVNSTSIEGDTTKMELTIDICTINNFK